MRYAAILALGAALLALCGCGASDKRATAYSVHQVEAAFKAHGLPLRQTRYGPAPGIVRLVHSGLEVDVDIGHQNGETKWLTGSTEPELDTAKRNMIVSWPPRYTESVRASLRQLH